MNLYLENIGKIGQTMVEINGITIIAGENNTGKSTIGRSLYSVFNSFYDIENKISQERINSIVKIIDNLNHGGSRRFSRKIRAMLSESIINNESNKIDKGLIESNLKEMIIQTNDELMIKNFAFIDEIIERVTDVLNISDMDIFKSVLNKNLDAEFNGQINNIFSNEKGRIQLKINEEELDIFIENNDVIKVSNIMNLQTEVVYIDDPYIFDESQYTILFNDYYHGGHRAHLKKNLKYRNKDKNIIEEIVINKKIEEIYTIISDVCDGEIVKDGTIGFGYKKAHSEKILDARNLSTGLKTFAIIKTLLLNGSIEYKGTIILDEPEIHLHPEWQLLFAEIIVLLQKVFHMHILLNTHSPYFLNAIEVYSAKHDIKEKCKYYLASMQGDVAGVEDVTDNLEIIYKKLAVPLQKLENQRYEV